MLSSQEIEHLLKHTTYSNQYDDDSDGDQDGEATLPICLPTPLLLVGDDDSNPRSANTKPLPLMTAHHHHHHHPSHQAFPQHHPNAPVHPLAVHPCILSTTDTDGEFVSQSENNISDSPVAMQLRGPPTPPPYTPADSARVAAEVDCCSAIEKTKVKTVMCLNYMHGRRCRFGAHCAFAHGAEELRQPPPEMMAKKQAIVSSSKPPLTATPPPSYREALAAPPAETPEMGATPAYDVAVREQQDHLPPPPPPATDALPPVLADVATVAPSSKSSTRSSAGPQRQRGQGSGGSARLTKTHPRRVKRSPV